MKNTCQDMVHMVKDMYRTIIHTASQSTFHLHQYIMMKIMKALDW